jgi:protein tyrosine/serine phosphatase
MLTGPLLVAALVGATASPSPPAAPAPRIENFGRIGPDLFRGAQLGPREFEELRRLGVRTILKLNRRGGEEEARLAKKAGIRVVHLPLETFDIDDDDSENVEALCRAMATLRDPSLRPLYVHCTHGVDRTGAIVGLYRRLVDGWDLEAIRREMDSFGSGPWRRLLTRGVWKVVETFDDGICGGENGKEGGATSERPGRPAEPLPR